ncbi:hypothetical protein V2J09_021324 [Rumex salicifolius]
MDLNGDENGDITFAVSEILAGKQLKRSFLSIGRVKRAAGKGMLGLQSKIVGDFIPFQTKLGMDFSQLGGGDVDSGDLGRNPSGAGGGGLLTTMQVGERATEVVGLTSTDRGGDSDASGWEVGEGGDVGVSSQKLSEGGDGEGDVGFMSSACPGRQEM